MFSQIHRLFGSLDRLAIDLLDHITRPQPRFGRSRIRVDFCHNHTIETVRQIEMLAHIVVDVSHGNAVQRAIIIRAAMVVLGQLLRARELLYSHFQRFALAVTQHFERHRLSRMRPSNFKFQVPAVAHLLAIELSDDIAILQTRFFGRAIRGDIAYQCALFIL